MVGSNQDVIRGSSVVPKATPEYFISAGQVKLPRLELKPFDRDIEHWNEFWSEFQNAVDQQSIPKVQKLNYLLNCLEGKAAQEVQGYLVTPKNYDIVKEILYRRFGDRTVLLRTFYAGLKSIRKDHDLRNTRKAETWKTDTTIEMTIEEKLPDGLLRKFTKQRKMIQLGALTSLLDYWNK
ncbi:unnamed protein product [Gongylonema pulchrum]|uniref:Uncharacterized protein n=1 Tax=Gongylonema pulchrum TaxID=637853 RepID=A0A183ECW0_9BILA|nr:unnamed protein product [Gongylonema pulchrum]